MKFENNVWKKFEVKTWLRDSICDLSRVFDATKYFYFFLPQELSENNFFSLMLNKLCCIVFDWIFEPVKLATNHSMLSSNFPIPNRLLRVNINSGHKLSFNLARTTTISLSLCVNAFREVIKITKDFNNCTPPTAPTCN